MHHQHQSSSSISSSHSFWSTDKKLLAASVAATVFQFWLSSTSSKRTNEWRNRAEWQMRIDLPMTIWGWGWSWSDLEWRRKKGKKGKSSSSKGFFLEPSPTHHNSTAAAADAASANLLFTIMGLLSADYPKREKKGEANQIQNGIAAFSPFPLSSRPI